MSRRSRWSGWQLWNALLKVAAFFAAVGGVWAAVTAGLWVWWPRLSFWAVGIVAVWIALALVIAGLVGLGLMLGRRRPDVFGAFNDAFVRIARGDYQVQIPLDALPRNGGPSEFHVLAENLNTMAGSLARVEELRRQFVADVSHEFQTPLTSILGFAQALRSAGLPEAQRLRYLAIVETEARRLSGLADTLLKLNALEDRATAPDPTAFRLDGQIRQVLVALEPQWSAKNLGLDADLDPVETVGNVGLWAQVWTNLVQNAVKFTPEGGTISLRLHGGAGWVAEVVDSGIGLTPDQGARVFERFYKADAARSGGNGLGLALVHRIVALHGARIEVESPGLGQGAVFRVISSSGG